MDLKRIRLFDHNFHTVIVFLPVSLSPPVNHISLRIKLATFVIKTMRHFMTYNRPHRSIIYSIIGIWIKKGWLQNRCRKHNFVQAGMVVSIDVLGIHEPLVTIGWCIHFLYIPKMMKRTRLEHHGQKFILSRNDKGSVIDPLVGISNLDIETRHFQETRLTSGITRHPIDLSETLLQGLPNTFHNFQSTVLARFIKIPGTIQLSQCFSQC
mmetsp:Transcript_19491/g.35380  ORF Transcript_19491/g.35380 Transcript_19491/m.35380 type:complete len:210 (-) Transcript_19491:1335-1964(-)